MTRRNGLRLSIAVMSCLLIAPTGLTEDQRTSTPLARASQAELIDFDKLGLPQRVDPRLESLPVPESITSLKGRRVQIRVFMRPQVESEDLPMFAGSPEVRQFYYQRSDGDACICDPETRRAQYKVAILLRRGTTIDWKNDRMSRPLLIEGELDLLDEPIDFEMGPIPFYIKDAIFREVAPQEGFGPYWYWGEC